MFVHKMKAYTRVLVSVRACCILIYLCRILYDSVLKISYSGQFNCSVLSLSIYLSQYVLIYTDIDDPIYESMGFVIYTIYLHIRRILYYLHVAYNGYKHYVATVIFVVTGILIFFLTRKVS